MYKIKYLAEAYEYIIVLLTCTQINTKCVSKQSSTAHDNEGMMSSYISFRNTTSLWCKAARDEV